MTSSSDTFPFGIADVVELLGLTVRRRLPSSLYLYQHTNSSIT